MNMKIHLKKDLIALAKAFKKHGADLFIVGGYIRNALLGFCETDIDVCSKLKAEEIKSILNPAKYEVKMVNPKLGTVHIYVKNSSSFYEHTTFRAEQYQKGGAHSPTEVRFVDDIPLDASRRDFTINSIYYNILTGQMIDYYNGTSDTLNHILRTVETPEYVFSRDGLRILRLVRFSCELAFVIEDHTLAVAQKMVSQLKDVSQERFNKEIIAILFADYKYEFIHSPKAHIHGLKKLSSLHAWEYVLPAFTKIVGKENISKLYTQDWCKLLSNAQPALRITAFVLDICRALKIEPTLEIINALLGTGGLMLNKKECLHQFAVLDAFTQSKQELSSDEQCRMFLQKHNKVIHELIALFQLTHSGNKLLRNYTMIKTDNIPLSISDLNINGNDIMEVFPYFEKEYYSKILSSFLTLTAIMPEINKKPILLREAEMLYNKIINRK